MVLQVASVLAPRALSLSLHQKIELDIGNSRRINATLLRARSRPVTSLHAGHGHGPNDGGGRLPAASHPRCRRHVPLHFQKEKQPGDAFVQPTKGGWESACGLVPVRLGAGGRQRGLHQRCTWPVQFLQAARLHAPRVHRKQAFAQQVLPHARRGGCRQQPGRQQPG